jgi:hypothetical protein
MHRRTGAPASPADPFSSGSDSAGDGYGPWFTASRSSECAGCWDVIDEGDRIRADGEGRYLCEDCGDADD